MATPATPAIDLSDLGGTPATTAPSVPKQPSSIDLSDLGGTPTVSPGTPTMSAAPKKGIIGKAIDAISEKEVPGTGVTVGEAGKRAGEFAHIAGSEAMALGGGPEGAVAKIAGVGGEAAQAILKADPADLGLAEWVQKMGIPAEEAPGLIRGALQSAGGSVGKFVKEVTDFAEAYPHLVKALKVGKAAGKVVGAGGTVASIYGAWKALKQ